MAESVQIEAYETAYANSNLKQVTAQIDPSDVKNSRISYKSQASQHVELVPYQKIVEMIQQGIPTSNIFVLVTTGEEFFIAMSSPLALNIWCEDVVTTSDDYSTIEILASKHIYTRKRQDLFIGGGGFNLNFETGGRDVYFHGPINPIVAITFGGTAGGCRVYFKSVYWPLSLPLVFDNANVNVEYERSTHDITSANTIVSGWSGNSTVLEIEEDQALLLAGNLKQTFKSPTGDILEYDRTMEDAVSPGYPRIEKILTINGVEQHKESVIQHGAGGDSVYYQRYLNAGALAHQISALGHNAFQTAPQPWGEELNPVQVGPLLASYSHSNDGLSGEANNCYKDGQGAWRLSNIGYAFYTEYDIATGTLKVYETQVSGTAGNALFNLTLVKAYERDKRGNEAFKGAPIPSDVDTAQRQVFNNPNQCTIYTTTGSSISGVGCYLTSTVGGYKALYGGTISLLAQSSAGTYTHYRKDGAVAGTVYDVGIDFTQTTIVP